MVQHKRIRTNQTPKMDKINLYNIEATKGCWAVIGRVKDDQVWKGIKDGTYNGLSIEAMFSEKEDLSEDEKIIDKIIKIIKEGD